MMKYFGKDEMGLPQFDVDLATFLLLAVGENGVVVLL
jgi:hypothetical protein